MMEQKPLILPSGADLDRFLAGITTKGLFISLMVAVLGAFHLFRRGYSTREIILLLGGISSMLGLLGYMMVIAQKIERGYSKRSYSGWLCAFGGLFPYAFGCYLVFYEGIWGMWLLVHGFSFSSALASILYLLAGYQVVLSIYRISELGQAIEDGRVVTKTSTT